MSFSQGSWIDGSHSEFEVLLVDCHSFENSSVDLFSLDVNYIHLFSDALKGRFSAEGSHVRAYKTVSLTSNRLKIYSFIEFHVLSVDSQDLKTTNFVRNSNVDFSIESTESSESRIKRVRSVGSSDYNNVTTTFESVHKGQQLRNNTSFDLTMYFLSIRGNRVNLIDENNCWTVFFSLLESFSEISLGLSSHLRHDLRTVDQEEESSSLICDCSGNQSLSRAWRTIKKDSSRWLDS